MQENLTQKTSLKPNVAYLVTDKLKTVDIN